MSERERESLRVRNKRIKVVKGTEKEKGQTHFLFKALSLKKYSAKEKGKTKNG